MEFIFSSLHKITDCTITTKEVRIDIYKMSLLYKEKIKSNQIKSNQIKSNQIKSNQIKS